MWAIFGIAFAFLVVAGSLLLGWGLPFIAIFGVALVAAALFFAFQRTAVEPVGDPEASGSEPPSWKRKHWWQ